MITLQRPLGPTCQTKTVLAQVTPGPIGCDIRTSVGPECKQVHQTVADLQADPMKCVTTNTWLRGQLQAPT